MVAVTVIGIIMGFLLLDLGIQYFTKRAAARAPALASQPGIAGFNPKKLLSDFLLPLGFFFHPGHTWARIQDEGVVTVGADDFSQKVLGRIDRVHLPQVGQELKANTPAFRVAQGQKEAAFAAPISGTVLEVNDELVRNPELMKTQPYKAGWAYKIRPSSIADDLKPLHIADRAVEWLKKEIGKFRDFIVEVAGRESELGTTVADGGVPVSGVMEQFQTADWQKFEQRFLTTGNEGSM